MSIEDLIVTYINKLSESMRQSARKFKEESGSAELFNLTITQLHYLHAIKNLDGPTLTELVEKFNVQKSTVTATINRLVERGLAYKIQSDQDLRVYHIYLSESGNGLLDIESRGYFYFAAKMTQCLTEAEKNQFAMLLQKIITNIDDDG